MIPIGFPDLYARNSIFTNHPGKFDTRSPSTLSSFREWLLMLRYEQSFVKEHSASTLTRFRSPFRSPLSFYSFFDLYSIYGYFDRYKEIVFKSFYQTIPLS